jgi:anti-sigma factor RsiW
MSDIHALSGAYAVDALDDGERAEFERHLTSCATCRAEVDSLREAAALLPETTATEPPAALRDRVLAAAATVRPLPPEVATVTPLAERRRPRRVTTLLAAAAAVVALGAGGVAWELGHDEGPQDQFSAIAQADDAKTFTVPLDGGGSATVVVSRQRNGAYIKTTGMPPAPSGHQYVLWLQHGLTMAPAGVMPADPDGTFLFSGDPASADGAAVSVENAGPMPSRPSDEVVASVSFDA